MINLFHKKYGAATLILTVVLIVVSTLVIIFASNFSQVQQKVIANLSRTKQAYSAAEAGMEYAINYLQQNSPTVLANPSGGFILPFSNSSTTNVVLANNSQYSFVYTNPTANNYNLIKITSTGKSDDGSSTRVISQFVQFGSMLVTPPKATFVTKGSFAMSGSAVVSNTSGTSTIQSASTVSLAGSASTVTSSGTSSTSGNIKSDITQNSVTLQNLSNNDLFASYMGATPSNIKSRVNTIYTNNSSFNYSSVLNNQTGTSIWIEQTGGTAQINSNTTIGSASAPVLLIVNGDLDIKGNVLIYGFIFVFGGGSAEADVTGNVVINGGMVATRNLSIAGTTTANYNPTVLTNLQNQSSMRYWAKVPGRWRDY